MSRIVFGLLLIGVFCASVFAGEFCFTGITIRENVATPTDGGIRENVPAKYRAKFDLWKAELLSTEFGKAQWSHFENNRAFILKIEVTGARDKGAGTGDLEFDDNGKLVGATVTLGSDIDKGYPNSYYYPVLGSLSVTEFIEPQYGRLLAVTKFSHELGHVDQILNESGELLRLQDKLMPQYSNIFLKNGRNTSDRRLIEIATRMGGTPTEIWEHREYKSETIALEFLAEKIAGESYVCDVLKRVQQNVDSNARQYRDLFIGSRSRAYTLCK